MSVGRGLFRGWIFLTVLWLIGAGTLAYFIIRREVSHWKWQYVHEARTNTLPGEVDWSRPYYEMMRSPSAEKLAVTFMEHPGVGPVCKGREVEDRKDAGR
jgi:hypothetical protein